MSGDDPNDMRYDLFIPAVTVTLTLLALLGVYISTTFKSPF